jgi:hypothetical protein
MSLHPSICLTVTQWSLICFTYLFLGLRPVAYMSLYLQHLVHRRAPQMFTEWIGFFQASLSLSTTPVPCSNLGTHLSPYHGSKNQDKDTQGIIFLWTEWQGEGDQVIWPQPIAVNVRDFIKEKHSTISTTCKGLRLVPTQRRGEVENGSSGVQIMSPEHHCFSLFSYINQAPVPLLFKAGDEFLPLTNKEHRIHRSP